MYLNSVGGQVDWNPTALGKTLVTRVNPYEVKYLMHKCSWNSEKCLHVFENITRISICNENHAFRIITTFPNFPLQISIFSVFIICWSPTCGVYIIRSNRINYKSLKLAVWEDWEKKLMFQIISVLILRKVPRKESILYYLSI